MGISILVRRTRYLLTECTQSWCSKNYGFVWWRCAAEVQKEVIKGDLSGMKCFGLTVDETTDVGVEKQLIVYLKTASTKRQKFLGLVTMTGSTADDIVQAIQGGAAGLWIGHSKYGQLLVGWMQYHSF